MWSETSWGLQFVVGAAAHAEHVNSAALARDVEYVWRFKPRTSFERRSMPENFLGGSPSVLMHCFDSIW